MSIDHSSNILIWSHHVLYTDRPFLSLNQCLMSNKIYKLMTSFQASFNLQSKPVLNINLLLYPFHTLYIVFVYSTYVFISCMTFYLPPNVILNDCYIMVVSTPIFSYWILGGVYVMNNNTMWHEPMSHVCQPVATFTMLNQTFAFSLKDFCKIRNLLKFKVIHMYTDSWLSDLSDAMNLNNP